MKKILIIFIFSLIYIYPQATNTAKLFNSYSNPYNPLLLGTPNRRMSFHNDTADFNLYIGKLSLKTLNNFNAYINGALDINTGSTIKLKSYKDIQFRMYDPIDTALLWHLTTLKGHPTNLINDQKTRFNIGSGGALYLYSDTTIEFYNSFNTYKFGDLDDDPSAFWCSGYNFHTVFDFDINSGQDIHFNAINGIYLSPPAVDAGGDGIFSTSTHYFGALSQTEKLGIDSLLLDASGDTAKIFFSNGKYAKLKLLYP